MLVLQLKPTDDGASFVWECPICGEVISDTTSTNIDQRRANVAVSARRHECDNSAARPPEGFTYSPERTADNGGVPTYRHRTRVMSDDGISTAEAIWDATDGTGVYVDAPANMTVAEFTEWARRLALFAAELEAAEGVRS